MSKSVTLRRQLGWGLTAARCGINTSYRWLGVPLVTVQDNPNFKTKILLGRVPLVSLPRAALSAVRLPVYPVESQRPRRIYLNIASLPFFDNPSGIPRVAKELAAAGLRTPSSGVLPVYPDPVTGQYLLAAAWARKRNLPVDHLPANRDVPLTLQAGDWLVHTMINPHEVDFEAASYAAMRARGVRVGFILHDLIAERHPEFFRARDARHFSHWLRLLAQYDGVFAVSSATLADYRSWCSQEQVSLPTDFCAGVFHLGADFQVRTQLTPKEKEILSGLRATPFFMQVSTIEPRKGYAQLLSAFELLWRQGSTLRLVLVGRPGWKVRGFTARLRRHPENGKRLLWLSGVSDALLCGLYQQAAAVVVASQAEGFGLSVVEAAHYQRWVLARDLPVFREVAGSGTLYFSGLQPQSLAAAITSLFDVVQRTPQPPHCAPPLTWQQSFSSFLSLFGSARAKNGILG